MISLKKIKENYRNSINKKYAWQIVLVFLFLIASIVLNYYSDVYAAKTASNPVSDIILSHIRVYDVDFLFVYGALALCLFFAILCLIDPKRIAFSIKAVALFVAIRAVFISLTHIAPFPSMLVIDTGSQFLNWFFTDSSLFFSGHVGLPFLLSLIFWKDKILRYIMLASSVVFGFVVLLGHLHYTIDVVAAFFITYSIYSLAEFFFKKDREYFYHGSVSSENQLK